MTISTSQGHSKDSEFFKGKIYSSKSNWMTVFLSQSQDWFLLGPWTWLNSFLKSHLFSQSTTVQTKLKVSSHKWNNTGGRKPWNWGGMPESHINFLFMILKISFLIYKSVFCGLLGYDNGKLKSKWVQLNIYLMPVII